MLENLLILFALGSSFGWFIEIFVRYYFHRKWVNPGILYGPYLPIYGLGIFILYFLADLSLKLTITIILMTSTLTILELLGGIFCEKLLSKRQWDYSHLRFNYLGHISLLHIFFWLFLSIFYYFFLHPNLIQLFSFTQNNNFIYLLLVIFYTVFFIDLVLNLHKAILTYNWQQ